jgi:hypothetical protein
VLSLRSGDAKRTKKIKASHPHFKNLRLAFLRSPSRFAALHFGTSHLENFTLVFIVRAQGRGVSSKGVGYFLSEDTF